MIIPHQQLSPSALRGLVEEFVTRDGTDYGLQEISLEQKVRSVLRQLDKGKVVIVFDPANESCHIVSRENLNENSVEISENLPEKTRKE